MPSAFAILIDTLLPLYAFIVAGLVAGRYVEVDAQIVARLMFYVINPLIFFVGGWRVPLDWNTVLVPPLVLGMCSAMGLGFWAVGKRIYGTKDTRSNLLGFLSGTGNTGYMGLPIVIALFDAKTVAYYVIAQFMTAIYQYTVGYYIISRGQVDARAALMRVVKVPTLYGFVLGLLMNIIGLHIPEAVETLHRYNLGAFTVCGMMMFGLALTRKHVFQLDLPFMLSAFATKFLVWPAFSLAIVLLDRNYLGLLAPEIHLSLMMIAIVPIASDTVMLSSLLNMRPSLVATTALISTLIGLITIPLMLRLLG